MSFLGFKVALDLYSHVSRKVPAYINFLSKNKKFFNKKINTYQDWIDLPLTTKDNYIKTYPLEKRIPKGKFPPMIYASSGTTGQPTYWYGSDEQEGLSKISHERLFKDMFGINKKDPTLLLISFAMDVWIAGHHTMIAGRDMSRLGYNFSVMTPGYSEERTLSALEAVGKNYKNIILAGHPAFVMDILTLAKKKKILSKKYNYKVLVTGHKISEKWRKDVIDLLGEKKYYNTVSSIYGSTDAGKMGYETPLSIFLRKESLKNKKLYKEIFGDAVDLPGLYQYHHKNIFFEEVNRELVITTNTAVPLLRYNMHDIGRVFNFSEIKNILLKLKLISKAKVIGLSAWNLPFVAVQGRSNVAATFYALHIYPDHIIAGIDKIKYLSGKFFAYTKTVNKSAKEKFYIVVELKKGLNLKDIDLKKESYINNKIIETLKAMNIEYKKLSEVLGKKALPSIVIKSYGSREFYPKGIKGIFKDNKGKAKIINI